MIRHLKLTVVSLALLPCFVQAQTSQGRISGLVTDPGGAVIPRAQVVAINEGTGVQTKAQSNDVGLYVLPFLSPGRYKISATMQGFKRYERPGILIETSQILELNIALELGPVTETMTVRSEAPLLQTSDATVGQFIDSRTVTDMPLAGRRALELVRLASNVIFVSYSGDAKPQFAVAGGRGYQSTYMLDGGNIQNIRMASAQVDIDPPVEVIQEFKVVSNGYAAEYGGSASGVLISTTKSGTNQFHGNAFEYFRNDKLDAPGFFAPVSGKTKIKAPLRYNLFGGTLGGPVVRNRTHFFAGYEATRKSDGSTQVMTVPDALQKAGNFSQTFESNGALIPIYDPNSTRTVSGRGVRDAFPGNIVPASRLDPVAAGLAKYWPAANRPAVNLAGAQNFAGNRARMFRRDNVTSRADHTVSDNNRFFFRLVYNRDPYSWTSNYPNKVGDPESPFSPTRWESSYMFKDTHTLSPSLITDAAYSFSNRRWYADSAGLGSNVVKEVGLPGVSNDAFPAITGTGMVNLGTSSERVQNPIRQHQFTNSWTWIKDKHVFKFGGELKKGINVDINRPIISGQYSFARTGTGQVGVGASGIAFASYMMGWVNGFSQRETELLDRYSWYTAGYAQDDWKIAPHLTLNLGLRWESDGPVMDRNNRTNSFDRYQINPVSRTPGVVKFTALGGWAAEPYFTDWNNFGPRLGFSWKPAGSDRWVVRGGYGLFYEGPSASANAATLGFEKSAASSSPDNGVTPAMILKNGPGIGLTAQELNDSFGAVAAGGRASTNVTFYEQNRRTGYAHHVNLGVQRMLPGNMVLDISYVGNLSRKLPNANLNINQVPAGKMGAGNAQILRPYPQFLNVTVLSPTNGSNNYHSGSIRVEKRFSAGLSFLAGYTWARAIGDTNDQTGDIGDNQVYMDVYNRRLDRGPDALDVVHRFAWSSTYDLPWGKGRAWLKQGWASQALGGWTLGSIANIQSGGPFTVTMQTDTSNAFLAGGLRANVLRDGNLPKAQRTAGRWFDTGAFAAPAAYQFGSAGRGILRGDGRINFDFSVNKNVPFGEARYVQLRADFFNAFNHPDFGLPNRGLGSANFGTIGSATDGRSIQFGLRVAF
ncbi:MAG: TonB-dependent receptor [Acidobacteria bacterium]|nr:TonB-dependent receptor [Acidobacteriota bacterium]